MLVLLACAVSGGAFAQVTNPMVSDASPCAGALESVSWDFGSGGGGPYSIKVSTVAYGLSDISSGIQPGNTFIFNVLSAGSTYYVTVTGLDNFQTNMPLITVDAAPTTPTGYTINGVPATMVCSATAFTLSATGGSAGTSGVLAWYASDMVTPLGGDPYMNAGIVAADNFYVRYEDAGCGVNTAFLSVPVGIYTNASAAATNFALDGVTYAAPVCAGSYTVSAVGAAGGDNPATDTLFFSDVTYTTPLANPITLASAGSQDIYIRITDGCTVTNFDSPLLGPAVANTTSVDGASLMASDASACSGTIVNFATDGTEILGTGGSYQYSGDGVNWTATTSAGADNFVDVTLTADTTITIRIVSPCDTTAGVSATTTLIVPSTPIDSVRPNFTQVCDGANVTFTAYGGVLSGGGIYEYQINGGGFLPNGISSSVTIPVTGPGLTTTVDFQITDACGTYPAAPDVTSTSSVDVATENVEPTSLTVTDNMDLPVAPPVCPGSTIRFRVDGGAILSDNVVTPAYYHFSSDVAFSDTLYLGSVQDYVDIVVSTTNNDVFVKMLGGCGPNGTVITNSIAVAAGSTVPTAITASGTLDGALADQDSICPQDVTLTAVGFVSSVVDNGMVDFGTVSNNVFTSISGPLTTDTYTIVGFNASAQYAIVYSSNCVVAGNAIDSIQLYPSIDNTNLTAIAITLDGNPINNGDVVCSAGIMTYTADGTPGTGATYEFTYSVDGGAAVVQNTALSNVLTLDLSALNPTTSLTVTAAIVGGCTDYSAMGQVVSNTVFGGSTPYTLISSTNDNFCANAGVSTTLQAYNGVGAANANVVWYTLDNANNIITMEQTQLFGTPGANILITAPTATTTYGVRLEGCDTTIFEVRTITVKDTSVAPTAIGVSPGSTVCAGSAVAFTANGGVVGTGAVYNWYEFGTNAPLGIGNPLFLTVNNDIEVYATLSGTCNTTVASPTAIVAIYDQNDVFVNDGTTCPSISLDLNSLVALGAGGSFSGTGVSGHFFSSATAGTYTITYTKSFGTCNFTQDFTVEVFDAPVAALVSVTDESGCGINDGQFEVSATGGTGTYDFNNGLTTSGAGFTSYTFTGISAGSYLVTAEDGNGCISPAITVVVGNPSALGASVSFTDVACFGSTTGTITAVGTGGVAPYTYSLNGGLAVNSGSFTGLGAGAYSVEVFDANSCSFIAFVNISAPSNPLDLTVDYYSDLTCFDSQDGKIANIFGAGGTAPYLYSINGGSFDTTTSFMNLAAGVYTITVKDAGLCEAPFSFSIEAPDTIKADVAIVNYTAADGYDIKITRTGGTGSLQIKLNNGAFTLDENFNNLPPATYTYVITDNNGCSITGQFTLTDPSSVGAVSKGVDFSVYPNPFTGSVSIKGEIAADMTVSMVDVYGKTVSVEVVRNGDTTTINTDHLAKGMYILSINGNGVNVSKKLIKE